MRDGSLGPSRSYLILAYVDDGMKGVPCAIISIRNIATHSLSGPFNCTGGADL